MTSKIKKINILIIGNILITEKLIIFLNKINFINIVGVITNKNRKKSDYSDISSLCTKLRIKSNISENINSKETIEWTKKLKPEFILCLGWSQILKKNFFNLAKRFTIGFHPSCLPMNKGKHPVIWSIILDNKYSCTTFFKIDEQIDNGKIINKKKFLIGKNEYVKKVYQKIINNAKIQLSSIFRDIKNQKKISFKKQIGKGNFWRKRSSIDGKIDWRMSGRSIFNHVRALSDPYPYAYFKYNERNYQIHRLSYKKSIKYKNIEPGRVLKNKKKLEVKCGDGFVRLEKIKPKIQINKGICL